MTQVKSRNMFVQIFIFIITFGIYGIYWFYQTGKELKSVAKDENASPGFWTILLFVPLAAVYSYYKYSALFSQVSSEKSNKWIVFILWLVFSPAVWFLVQKDLNEVAEGQ